MQEVCDERDLLLNEGFCIADTGEQAVVTRGREGALANLLLGDEEAGALRLVAILGPVGEQRGEPGLHVGGDVDDEGWAVRRRRARRMRILNGRCGAPSMGALVSPAWKHAS